MGGVKNTFFSMGDKTNGTLWTVHLREQQQSRLKNKTWISTEE